MKPLNVFIHIPKTGGMTFQKILTDNHKKFKRINDNSDWREKYDDCDWVVGHVTPAWINIGRRFHDVVPKFYTLLRNPVERTLSYYRHTGHKVCVVDWIKQQRTNSNWTNIDNAMVRFLGCYSAKTTPGRDELVGAKRFLDRNNFGFTERYNESMKLWGLLEPLSIENQTERGEYSDDDCREIEKRNVLDLELYEYAKKLWEKNAKI